MRHVLEAVRRCGRVVTSDLAKEVDKPASTIEKSLDGLLARRLVMRDEDAYVSLQSVM
jgi:DNA-binding IclR family transcriptional regulator